MNRHQPVCESAQEMLHIITRLRREVELLRAERNRYYHLLTRALSTATEVKVISATSGSLVATDGPSININQHIEYINNLREGVAAQPENSPTFARVAKNTALDIIGGALKDVAKGQVKKAAEQIIELSKDLGPAIVSTAAYAFFKNVMQGG
jgi:hypothetical protein